MVEKGKCMLKKFEAEGTRSNGIGNNNSKQKSLMMMIWFEYAKRLIRLKENLIQKIDEEIGDHIACVFLFFIQNLQLPFCLPSISYRI